jgi:hypothetical protein
MYKEVNIPSLESIIKGSLKVDKINIIDFLKLKRYGKSQFENGFR